MTDLEEIKVMTEEYSLEKVNYLLKRGWILLKVVESSDGEYSGASYVLGSRFTKSKEAK